MNSTEPIDINEKWKQGTWNIRAEKSMSALTSIINANADQIHILRDSLLILMHIKNSNNFYEMLKNPEKAQEYSNILSSIFKHTINYKVDPSFQ